jgi:hypothetical protein
VAVGNFTLVFMPPNVSHYKPVRHVGKRGLLGEAVGLKLSVRLAMGRQKKIKMQSESDVHFQSYANDPSLDGGSKKIILPAAFHESIRGDRTIKGEIRDRLGDRLKEIMGNESGDTGDDGAGGL